MDEDDKLLAAMVISMTCFFIALVWVMNYKVEPEYVITYEQPATIAELPYELFDDPPVEKELGDWTMKFYEAPKGEIKLTEREELAESMTFYKNVELTAYAYTGCAAADGTQPQEWVTAACNDPYLWHKWVYLPGYGKFWINDTGAMSMNVIDLYLGDYDTCIQFGRQVSECYILD